MEEVATYQGRSNFQDSITSPKDKLKANHRQLQRYLDSLENTGFLVSQSQSTAKGLAKPKSLSVDPLPKDSGIQALLQLFSWKSEGPQVHLQHLKTPYGERNVGQKSQGISQYPTDKMGGGGEAIPFYLFLLFANFKYFS